MANIKKNIKKYENGVVSSHISLEEPMQSQQSSKTPFLEPTPSQQSSISQVDPLLFPKEIHLLKENFNQRLIGYPEDIVHLLIVAMLAERNILLLGKHGLGKTTAAHWLAKVSGMKHVIYDASKDDIISICGIPVPDKLSKEELVFAKHPRTIWNQELVFVDEISRANRENQNMWLEIIQERKLFGQKLACRLFLATCNPESYSSSYDLDVALLDRFTVLIPLPDFQDTSKDIIKRIVHVNLQNSEKDMVQKMDIDNFKQTLARCREYLLKKPVLVAIVMQWIAEVIKILFENSRASDPQFISPRTFGFHLPNLIFDLLAYDYACDKELSPTLMIKRLELAVIFALKSKFEKSINNALRVSRNLIERWLTNSSDLEIENICTCLSISNLELKIVILHTLDLDKIYPEDKPKVHLLIRQIMLDILKTYNPSLYQEFWQICNKWKDSLFSTLRHELEVEILRKKLEKLLSVAKPKYYKKETMENDCSLIREREEDSFYEKLEEENDIEYGDYEGYKKDENDISELIRFRKYHKFNIHYGTSPISSSFSLSTYFSVSNFTYENI